LCRVVDVILEAPPVFADREETMHVFSMFVETLSESNRCDLDLMRDDLACELPLGWLVWVRLLFEEADSFIGVAYGKVHTITRDDKLLDWVTFIV
jgi:hypothetical protein